jgi:acetyl-CoA acetyltransferase
LQPAQKPLARAGLTLHDVDLMELNEFFAGLAITVLRQPGPAAGAGRLNPHGGPSVPGHPPDMSGACRAVKTPDRKHAIATIGAGADRGTAVPNGRA